MGCQTVRTRYKWSEQGMRDPAYSHGKCGVCLTAPVTDCKSVTRHYRLRWCLRRIKLLKEVPSTGAPHTCSCAFGGTQWQCHSCWQSADNAQNVSNFRSAPCPRRVKNPREQTLSHIPVRRTRLQTQQLRTGNREGRRAQKRKDKTECTGRILRPEEDCSVEYAKERTALQTV